MDRETANQFGLGKLLYSLMALFLCYRVFSNLPQSWIIKAPQAGPSFYTTVGRAYVVTGLFLLLEMLVVLFAYRPLGALMRCEVKPAVGTFVNWRDSLTGAGLGIGAVVVSAPLLSGPHVRVIVNAVFRRPWPPDAPTIALFLLFSLFLPAAITVVLCGVILRSLLIHAGAAPSILGGAVFVAYLCPVLASPAVALIFAAVTGALYCRRNLWSALTANVVMSGLSITYVLWKVWGG